jgi:DNA mismatch repair protein MutL
MPSKIRVLSDHTINQIAAGEVIENPASVVKELVENSLDAGASELCIEIKGGGRQMIRVTDNGCGMSADDALLCLERHATSKIREVDDLDLINSMGFRGEAIPSIASISKFMLLTCPQSEEKKTTLHENTGTLIMVDGGNILKCCPAACSPGTTIEVKSLFFNVPVRRKFQRSPTHDAAEILKMLSILAIGHPGTKFQLISNGETTLQTLPSTEAESFNDLLGARIKSILGSDFFHSLCPLDSTKDGMAMRGFIGLPSCTRHQRTGQFLFINRRAVYSSSISYGIREGYGPMLAPNRHPLYVLHLTLPGDLVDVNVHPQKREVRLRQEPEIKGWIAQSVERALCAAGASHPVEMESIPLTMPMSPMPMPHLISTLEGLNSSSLSQSKEQALWTPPPPPSKRSDEPWLFKTAEPPKSHPSSKVLATIPNYILIDSQAFPQFAKSGFCLVDQKCAHMRVIYEKLEHTQADAISSQQLLLPYMLKTTPLETAVLKQHLNTLTDFGISIQEFGQDTFMIDAISNLFDREDIGGIMADWLRSANESTNLSLFQKEQKRILASSASRLSVARKHQLKIEEAQFLIDQLVRCQHPYHCPQGKPTIVHIGHEELAKYFQNKASS